jgi:hypothetical protein
LDSSCTWCSLANFYHDLIFTDQNRLSNNYTSSEFRVAFKFASQLCISLPNYRMIAVIEFPARGKGLFALKKTIKVLEGAECSLQRDGNNRYGE